MEFDNTDGQVCEWKNTDGPPDYEISLQKGGTDDPDFDHAYRWACQVFDGNNTDTFTQDYVWDDSELPIDPFFQPGCQANWNLLNDDLIPKQVDILKIPQWVCSTQDIRDWWERGAFKLPERTGRVNHRERKKAP